MSELVDTTASQIDAYCLDLSSYMRDGFVADMTIIERAANTGTRGVDGGDLEAFLAQLEAAIGRVLARGYGSPLNGMRLPNRFHETPFGIIISDARAFSYPEEAFCETLAQAAKFINRDRTMMRQYVARGLIMPVARHGTLHYLWNDLRKLRTILAKEDFDEDG